jgi:hypothetical protein
MKTQKKIMECRGVLIMKRLEDRIREWWQRHVEAKFGGAVRVF